MSEALLAGLVTFVAIFVFLRAVEYAYHHLRHTPDWSPHWGSWVFAVLAGLYVAIINYGR